MDTLTKNLCSLERNYYRLLLQKRSDPLKLTKLQILKKAIKNHHCKYRKHLVASTQPNYSAIVTPSQVEFFYERKSVEILPFHRQYDANKILDIWSRLGCSPQDAGRVYEACKSFVGLDWAQITLSPDRGSVLYRSKVIVDIF